MHTKAYTGFIGLFLFTILNFLGTPKLFAQEAIFDLRFQTVVDCNQDELTATLQIKVRSDSFRIGTSSILFNYDETIIAFKDYESITFNENNKVSIFGTEQPVWSPHKFNSTVPGICNLTLLIDIAAASLPSVKTEWMDIGKVSFDVLNLNGSPNLSFDISNTNFNRYDPNDGSQAPTKGDFLNSNDLLATQCACSAPIVTNDTLNFDCFENSFMANLISNDAISNATFSITSNPSQGTATINENGQMTYTATDFFCGSDQLTYQVCNDGDAQCCAEAAVFITFLDEVAPVFSNAPADMTVSCGDLPAMEPIAAADVCSEMVMTQDETSVPGACANSKVYTRTWTAYDGCGNSSIHTQNITTIDDIAPEISCLEDVIIYCGSTNGTFIDSGLPTYSDNCSDSTEITLTFSDGEFQEICQNKVQRQFTRTWTATDACGNLATCNQVIQMIDDVAPLLFCPEDITVNCGDDISINSIPSAEAFDSCSAVTISFTDVGEMPDECNFDDQTIVRTWVAEDACGNTTACVQEIIIQGSPCSPAISREITNYLCEGATVNLKSMMGFEDDATVSIFEGNEEPITNSTAFDLPLTGCETGIFEFIFQTYNESQCLLEDSRLTIKTIPNLLISPFLAADECSAELIFECPDLYEVTWSDGTNSGEGNTYFATPGQSGVVVYTIKYVDDNLPDSLDLICLTDFYEIEFNCNSNCPPGIQETLKIAGCEGDFINLINELQINDGDSIVSSIATINDLFEYELIATSDACGVFKEEFSVTIYNEDDCPVRFVNLEIDIIKKINGIITHEDDFCTVILDLPCSELYEVTWKDDGENTGDGLVYEGGEGSSGFVTFYVNLLDTTLLNYACTAATFSGDYACPTNCPETIERNESFTVCAETIFNVLDRLTLSNDIQYVVDNELVIDSVYNVGNPFGCEEGSKNIEIKGYDENQCLVEIILLEIRIIPAVYGDILAQTDTSCIVKLGLECPENYNIVWEDSNGKTGEGTSYIAEENTSGTVKFTVNYIPEKVILSGVELVCINKTFEASFNCTSVCPEITERVETFVACAASTVNIFDRIDLVDDKNYIIDNEEIIDGVYQIGNPFGCDLGVKNYQIKGYDENQCLVEIINAEITVIPAIYGNILENTTTTCEVKLGLECPENYHITWEDSNDRTGEGLTYVAEEGTEGFVEFLVEYVSDEIILSERDLACFSQTFEADFNCEKICPETIEKNEYISVCAESTINIFDRINLTTDKNYIIDSEEIIDGVYQIGNPFGCETGVKTYQIKGYDENQCLVEIINIEITVIPAIYGQIRTSLDATCKVSLVLECAENYVVFWEDSNGETGEGAEYTADDNTSGTVKFTVEYATDEIILSEVELGCLSQIFETEFNCSLDCPAITERDESITVCAETTVNIFDRIDLIADLSYEIENEAIIDGVYEIGNPFGCETGVKTYQIKGYDENQCLVEIIHIEIIVISAIYGDIIVNTTATCEVKLGLECPENYLITWIDDKGKTGTGITYVAEEGTEGSVEFLVEYATDEIILSEVELGCLSQIFEAEFNCSLDCPAITERDESITVCAETTVNIFDRIDLIADLSYEIENEAIIDGVYEIGNPFGCETGVKTYQIKGYDENQCLVEVINVEITIIPAIYGQVRTSSDATCNVSLVLECAENYIITWEDNNGNFGDGVNYTAIENTSGTVKFTVEYLTDDIILSEFELDCYSQVFEATFNCISDCPDAFDEIVELVGCHGDVINLKERLDFSDNLSYTILDEDRDSIIEEIVLENNNSDCSIETFFISAKLIDENNCVRRYLSIEFKVLPEINANIVSATEGCGVQLDLACAENYTVFWKDNFGNTGEGLTYEAVGDITGAVEFEITYKNNTLIDELVDVSCYSTSISVDFGCCNPVGTTCDDGKAETFGDQEDGECGCFGTPCALENKGIVFDGSEIAGCSLLIEMADGIILEPATIPEGVELVAGQEVLFSFVELSDRASVCQSGKIVEIICIENTCPEKGTPCTDGDLATINDAQDGNCNCVGESVPEVESEIDLRFRPSLDCETNVYCVVLQAKAQQQDFSIGTSSIMVNYNADALEFASYSSRQFDEKETCIGGTSSPWGAHQYDATSVPGKMCLTMMLDAEGVSCPEITTQKWEGIGKICFDIMDNTEMANITFDTSKTNFNSSSPNDGTESIKIGALHEIIAEDALTCAENDEVVVNEIAIKAFLQGAYTANTGRMTDVLRKKNFIPLTEPYTGLPSFVHFGEGGGETVSYEVLQVTGNNAIVDWVFLELRSASDAKTVIATRAGLLQRDGDIVEVDGVSNLQFMVPNDSYYISVKHRNHLGAMTREPIDFSVAGTTVVDFTDPNTPTYGTNAQTKIKETMTLWGGNANPDKYIILAGGGLGLPDRDMIFFDIFLSFWFANPDRPITYNSVLQGYYGSDTNLDGKVKYQGPRNDIDAIIFFNVLFHPMNTQYRLNFSISEQIP